MGNGVPREVLRPKNLGACGPSGFWPCDLPRHSIHHDTPSAFPNNVPEYIVHSVHIGQSIFHDIQYTIFSESSKSCTMSNVQC